MSDIFNYSCRSPWRRDAYSSSGFITQSHSSVSPSTSSPCPASPWPARSRRLRGETGTSSMFSITSSKSGVGSKCRPVTEMLLVETSCTCNDTLKWDILSTVVAANINTLGSRYPKKRGSRYRYNYMGSWYPYKGQNVVQNRKLINGFEGLNMQISKTYAEPL